MKYQIKKRVYEVGYKINHEWNYTRIITTIHDEDIEKINEELKTKYGEESWFYDGYEYYFQKVVLPNIINSNSWKIKSLKSYEVMEVT